MAQVKGALAVTLGTFSLDVEFAFSPEAVTVLMGRSGAGKSTLLRCLAGFEQARGEVSFGDILWQKGPTFVPAYQREVGYVFQEASLFPHLSVEGNLRLGFSQVAVPRFTWEQVVAVFKLQELLARAPQTLSGGEKQRVSLARALLVSPRVLFLDEPTSSLDLASKNEILPFVRLIRREFKIPVIYVTHCPLEALKIGDELFLLEGGRKKDFGPIQEVFLRHEVLKNEIANLNRLSGFIGTSP